MKRSNYFKLVLAGLVAFGLASCATIGNESLKAETEQTIATKIVENKTTKEQVKQMFGSPLSVSFSNDGHEMWTYEFTKASADWNNFIPIYSWFKSSVSGTKKSLVILFKNDKVWKYTMSESEVKHSSGIIPQ